MPSDSLAIVAQVTFAAIICGFPAIQLAFSSVDQEPSELGIFSGIQWGMTVDQVVASVGDGYFSRINLGDLQRSRQELEQAAQRQMNLPPGEGEVVQYLTSLFGEAGFTAYSFNRDGQLHAVSTSFFLGNIPPYEAGRLEAHLNDADLAEQEATLRSILDSYGVDVPRDANRKEVLALWADLMSSSLGTSRPPVERPLVFYRRHADSLLQEVTAILGMPVISSGDVPWVAHWLSPATVVMTGLTSNLTMGFHVYSREYRGPATPPQFDELVGMLEEMSKVR